MEPILASERKSLKQSMIDELKKYIIDEQLQAGDKLPPERQLAEQFDVSRSVVREALSYLENIGIIRVRQGQGAFIEASNIEQLIESFLFLWQINQTNIHDILSLRVIFECSAIDEILNKQDELAIQQLQETVTEGKKMKEQDKWQAADIAFHQTLLQVTDNTLFTQLTTIITSYFFQIQHITLTTAEFNKMMEEHQHIIDAIVAGDALQAKTLLTKHIKKTKA